MSKILIESIHNVFLVRYLYQGERFYKFKLQVGAGVKINLSEMQMKELKWGLEKLDNTELDNGPVSDSI